MVDTIPLPPGDHAGGIMVLDYTNGTDTHRQNLHVQPLTSADHTQYVAPTNGGVADNGWASEATIIDTFNQYKSVWATFFTAAWTLSLAAFYYNDVADLSQPANMVEQFPLPAVVPQAGTHAGAEATGLQRAGLFIYSSRSKNGGRARFVIVGTPWWAASTPSIVAGGAPGDADNNKQLVGYLTSKATGICCHDGFQAIGPMHRTCPYSRKLRRRYGFA